MGMTSAVLSRTWQNRIGYGRRLVRRAGHVLVVVGTVIGLAAGVKVFLMAPHPDDADIASISFRVGNQRDAAGQFAANFVGTVLTTPPSSRAGALARFITVRASTTTAGAADRAGGDQAPAVIDSTKVWSVVATGAAGEASLYAVIVVVQQRAYASAPSTVAYYRVPVAVWHYQPRAMDMPTPISDPGPGADVALRYDHALTPAGAVYAVVAGFITSYLTSTAALDRYVIADSWIKPIGGYQNAVVTTAASDVEVPAQPGPGTRIRVRATVEAQTAQFALLPFTFALTVENSGGTWMIADLDPQPVTAEDPGTPLALPSHP
jgi:hypothetical protein